MSPLLRTLSPMLVLQQPQFTAVSVALLAAALAAALWAVGAFARTRRLAQDSRHSDDSASELWANLSAAPAIPAEIAECAYLHLAERYEADDFQIGTFEDSRFSTLIWVRHGTRQAIAPFPLSETDPGIVGWVRTTGGALLVQDFARQADSLPARPANQGDDSPCSGVFVPLVVHDSVIGVMALQSRRPGAFTERHLAGIQLLASPIASALASAKLKAEGADRARHLSLLREIAIRMTLLAPLPELLPEVASLLQAGGGWEQVSIFEHKAGRLLLRAVAGEATGLAPEFSLDDPAPIAQAAAAASTVRELQRTETGSALPWVQAASIPLGIEGRMLGVLHIRAGEGVAIDAEGIDLAETVAHQLALIMLEARNFAQQQEEAWVTTVLLEVARHAAQPGDAEHALQAVLRLTTLLAGTSWAVLLLPDPVSGALKFGPSAGLRRTARHDQAPLGLAPEALGVRPPYRESEEVRRIDLPEPLREVTASPDAMALSLSDGESLLGVLLLEAPEIPGDRPALLMGIAHQISLRIENSRLVELVTARRSLEREIAMARDIQTSFLPRVLPEYDGWDLGVTWQLARMVGGDFYDFFQMPDGPNGPRWAVVVADVAGKGIPASLFMALSRTLIRSVAFSRIDPGQTLQRANDLIISDSQSNMFVSVVFGLWEPAIARFAYANGGHNPPVLLAPDHQVTLLPRHGMVLGVREAERYETQTLDLKHGSGIVLYTDGVTDASNAVGEPFGADRLLETLRSQHGGSAQDLSTAIHQQVAAYGADTELDDDLTVVVLRRLLLPPKKPDPRTGRSR